MRPHAFLIRCCLLIAVGVGFCFTAQAAGNTATFHQVADVVLPGPSGRFDYAARDPRSGLLWLNQMGADRLLVFDPKTRRVVSNIHDLSTPTGITLAPQRRLAFVSNAGGLFARVAGHGSVAVVDLDTRKILARLPAGHFPDGSAWVPGSGRLFVSNELGGSETVIGGAPLRREKTIALGGEAGMSAYDPSDDRVLVNVQTRDQIVAIDPKTLHIVSRTALPAACQHNHGLLVDAPDRLAFVACDGNARLLVLSLPQLRPVQASLALGKDPDVLALGPEHRHLIVAGESGVVAVFGIAGGHLQPLWRGFVGRDAHVVVADPETGRLYFPLEKLKGQPALRIVEFQP